MKIANFITFSRLVFSLFIVLFLNNPILAFVFLCLASLSDVLDGFIARKLKQESEEGKILDKSVDYFCAIVIIPVLLYLRSGIFLALIAFAILFTTLSFLFLRLLKDKNIQGVKFGRVYMNVIYFVLVSALIFNLYWKEALILSSIFYATNSALFLLGVNKKEQH